MMVTRFLDLSDFRVYIAAKAHTNCNGHDLPGAAQHRPKS